MTWIVTELQIQGVKGILDRSGDFFLAKKNKPKSIALFAPNGCGKSGYADAVEYFFSEGGEVAHLGKGNADSEKGGKYAIPHILAEEKGIEPTISISILNTGNGKKEKILRKVKTGRIDKRPEALSRVLQIAPAHRILRQHDLRNFVVDMSPGDKYSELSRWIGLTKLENVLKHLTTTSNALQDTNLDREIGERERDIIKYTNGEVSGYNIEGVFRWSSLKAKEFLNEEVEIKTIQDYPEVIKRLKDSREGSIYASVAADAYRAKQSLQKRLGDLVNNDGSIKICSNSFVTAFSKYKKVKTARELAKENIFKEVWENAYKLLSQKEFDQCPICHTKWSNSPLGSQKDVCIHLQDSLSKLSDLQEAETEFNAALKFYETNITDLNTEWESLVKLFQTLNLNDLQSIIKEISESINKLNEYDFPSLSNDHAFRGIFTQVNTLVSKKIIPVVDRVEIQGIPSEADQIENIINGLNNLCAALDRLQNLKTELREYRKVESQFELIANAIRTESSDLVNQIIGQFKNDVTNIYKAIHPNSYVPNIYIEPDTDKRTLLLRIDFHATGRTVPPAGYLSESYINTLGLALFLSSIRMFNKEFPFVFLDDIVSSYDANHRARIVDVVAEELSDFQVFLTTHDWRFYTMLRERLCDKGWIFEKIERWDLHHGPFRVPDDGDVQEINQLIKAGNPKIAGNAARQFIENWLDKICEKFNVLTVHKRGFREYNRTIFDFWGPFINRLQTIKEDFFKDRIETQPCYERLRSTSLLNYYSHAQQNPYEWGEIMDVEYVFTEFLSFTELFNCACCGKQLLYDQDSKRMYCLCGGQIFSPLEN